MLFDFLMFPWKHPVMLHIQFIIFLTSEEDD